MDTQSQTDISGRELDLMERRCAAASPGPWYSLVVGRDMEAGLNCIELGCYSLMEVLGGSVADQDFIASAREDVPRLIGQVRRLHAEMKVQAALLSITTSRPAVSTGGIPCHAADRPGDAG